VANETWQRLNDLSSVGQGDAYQLLEAWRDNKIPDVSLIGGISVEVGDTVTIHLVENAISVEIETPDIIIEEPDAAVMVEPNEIEVSNLNGD